MHSLACFQGMQINPGVATIERSLRDALVLSGGISKDNENRFSVLKWCRSARTDKGVSALGQVVALRLMHPDGLLQRLQSHLPSKIKVFGFRFALAPA
jgi:tRNA pseudouridine38-40 synthase